MGFPLFRFRQWRAGRAAGVSSFFILPVAVCMAATVAVAQIPDRLWQEDGRIRGNPQAPLTLIEYSDFTCGFCVRFFRETWPHLQAKYVNTGKLRFMYRDYPRDPNGPAMTGALAARCAGEQGRYWEMHDRLFASSIEVEIVQAHAKAVKLNVTAFTQCLRDARYAPAILQDKEDGLKLGFVGTPGFVLYRTTRAGKEKPIGLPGAFPAGVFEEAIERLLKLEAQEKS